MSEAHQRHHKKLSNTDPKTAMVVIEIPLDEAAAMLPIAERQALMREFATLANPT